MNFERNYDVLKSKSSCILFNKNINFNKNETESKMKNPAHSVREEKCYLVYDKHPNTVEFLVYVVPNLSITLSKIFH